MKQGHLRTSPEFAKAFLAENEQILWENNVTIPLLLKFWIGVVIVIVGLIGYEIIRLTVNDLAFSYFILLYLITLFLPALAIDRVNKARTRFYDVTDQRIIIERGNRYRWLFHNEIDKIRISDRLSFVGFVGLEHLHFLTKGADKPYGRTPDKNGVIYAVYEKDGRYYEYPPRPVTTDGFLYLRRGEAETVKQIVLNLRSRLNSSSKKPADMSD